MELAIGGCSKDHKGDAGNLTKNKTDVEKSVKMTEEQTLFNQNDGITVQIGCYVDCNSGSKKLR